MVPRDPEQILQFLAPLPIKRIWGIGKVTGKRLNDFDITIIADLQRLSEATLIEILGVKGGHRIYQLSHGLDNRQIVAREPEKSISNEHTFREDCGDWAVVEQSLLMLTEKVGGRLRKADYLARTAQVKLRWSNFQTITRQISLDPPLQTDRGLIDAALMLLERERQPRTVRLIGFGVSNLVEPDAPVEYQPDLFTDVNKPKEDIRNKPLDEAVDRIRDQFGTTSLHRGNWKRK
ncbi:hypothetical protein BVY04_03665 [bacterium M21]|nr:hypothetical protein BVY04_03665 [bacterium M21]